MSFLRVIPGEKEIVADCIEHLRLRVVLGNVLFFLFPQGWVILRVMPLGPGSGLSVESEDVFHDDGFLAFRPHRDDGRTDPEIVLEVRDVVPARFRQLVE